MVPKGVTILEASAEFVAEVERVHGDRVPFGEDVTERLVRIQQWRLERLGSTPGQRGEFVVNGEVCYSDEQWHDHGPRGDSELPTYSFLLYREGEDDPSYVGYGRAEFEQE